MLVVAGGCVESSEGHTSDTDGSNLESASDESDVSAHSRQPSAPAPAPPAKKRKLKIHKPKYIWDSTKVSFLLI